MAKLFFIGDSITAGAWDAKGGWVAQLAGQLLAKTGTSEAKHRGFYCMPYNLGVSGDTVADVIRRFEKELATRTYGDSELDTVELVFAVGVNDSVYLLNEDRNHATDEVFEEDLRTLITRAKVLSNRISFVGLLPVAEDQVSPCPWNPLLGYQNESIKRFNNIIKNVCTSEDITFLDLFDDWAAKDNLKDYLSDGLHPNTAGHNKIAEQIGDFIFNDSFDAYHTKE